MPPPGQLYLDKPTYFGSMQPVKLKDCFTSPRSLPVGEVVSEPDFTNAVFTNVKSVNPTRRVVFF